MSMITAHGMAAVRKSENTNALLRQGFSAMVEFDARVRAEKKAADLRKALGAGAASKRIPSRKKAHPHRPISIPSTSAKRADTVAGLIEELNRLKPQMHNEQCYSQLAKKHSDFLCFEIANGRPDLRTKLENLQDHRRHFRLAQELAAARHGNELSTIQTDWKKNKPERYKQGATH